MNLTCTRIISGLFSVMMLSACKDKTLEPPTTGDEATKTGDSKVLATQKSWKEKLEAMAWIRSGQTTVKKYSAEAQDALAQVDMKDLQLQAEGIKTALKTNDYGSAQVFADKLDKSLDSTTIGFSVRCLEIKKHLSDVKLSPEERKFFEDLQTSIASIDSDQAINIIAFAAGIACDIKFGHGGVHTAYLVDEGLRYAFEIKRKNPDEPSFFKYPQE
jgi:hypothetical protein